MVRSHGTASRFPSPRERSERRGRGTDGRIPCPSAPALSVIFLLSSTPRSPPPPTPPPPFAARMGGGEPRGRAVITKTTGRSAQPNVSSPPLPERLRVLF